MAGTTKARRQRFIEDQGRAGGECWVCGLHFLLHPERSQHVHHLTRDFRQGHEPDWALRLLCDLCHHAVHYPDDPMSSRPHLALINREDDLDYERGVRRWGSMWRMDRYFLLASTAPPMRRDLDAPIVVMTWPPSPGKRLIQGRQAVAPS